MCDVMLLSFICPVDVIFMNYALCYIAKNFLSLEKSLWRVWDRGEGCTGFWWGNVREKDHWGDPNADGRIILRWIFRKWGGL